MSSLTMSEKQEHEHHVAAPTTTDGEESPTPADTDQEVSKTPGHDQVLEAARSDEDTEYPSGLKLAVLMVSIFTSLFLVSLVRNLVFSLRQTHST